AAYPFAHGQSGLSLGDYIVDAIPEKGGLQGALSASEESLERFERIHQRLAGRLACMAEIMETAMGMPPLKGEPLDMNWTELVNPDAAGALPSGFRPERKADNSPGVRMAALLQKTRARFGYAPRSFSLGQRLYNHIRIPSAMRDVADGAYKFIYRDQNLLMNRGRVVWGHIIQANELLFKPGPHDCPAAVVFSLDPWYENNLARLESIAHDLYNLKAEKKGDREIDFFADVLRDEGTPMFSTVIPKAITGKIPVFYTTIVVHRKHLPVNYLNSVWFPLLINPIKTVAAMILPARYWDPDLINFW
ncbi:MAG: hypothetical protein GY859_44280, partial [Desulfobacterales bacterium]|nr:hypothetical protein [Desulfobacterales bacterium]